MSGSLDGSRSTTAPRGQRIRPLPVSSATPSLAEMVGEVLPTATTSKAEHQSERVDWVQFQHCDLDDVRCKEQLRAVVGDALPVVLVVGLARGYQVWALTEERECVELLSDRQGAAKLVLLLSTPRQCDGWPLAADAFAGARPLVAVCDSVCAVALRQYTSLSFVSLRSADHVHSLRFEDPIASVQQSSSVLAVCFVDMQKPDDVGSASVCSLGSLWFAYADCKLSPVYQSVGGVSVGDSSQTYASHVFNAAKSLGKTVASLGDTADGGGSVVTVLDLAAFPRTQMGVHAGDSGCVRGVVAHFAAHTDEPVGALQLAPGGALLLTCGASGQQFHLFALHPHPTSAALSAVQHLYTLYRGRTPARVSDVAFSHDSRWIGVTTNHGTLHVFPITPYGGPINCRTHLGPKLVNREGRFRQTAGLDSIDAPPAASLSPSARRGSAAHSLSAGNPRSHPPPVLVYAAAKFKANVLSAKSISARAADLTPSALSTGGSPTKRSHLQASTARHLAVRFAAPSSRQHESHSNASYYLYWMSLDGNLREFNLAVDAAGQKPKPSSDAPIQATLTQMSAWQLRRTKATSEIRPPLSDKHLMLSASATCLASASHDARRLGSDAHEQAVPLPSSGTPAWVSQVEMITYAGPHRRLWMGPQFSLKTLVDPMQHSTAQLVSPADMSRPARSEPLSTPARSVARRSVPVVIEATSGSFERGAGGDGATMEVCGSWSDSDFISHDEREQRVRRSIAEAIDERGPMAAAAAPDEPPPSPMEDARSTFSDSPASLDSLQFVANMDL